MNRPGVRVSHLPHRGTCLTEHTHYRQPDPVPSELLLHGRLHVDLARTASACCPGR
ncbi:putative leader peptide [Streptomyces sp. MUM 2J]|uniref:putative leader peptide n=1 Tax=Streptomyces sp. MUM 2J TaxID=2791987 RepID=UPI0035ABC2B2